MQDVKGFKVGDRVAADNSELCNECFYCRRGQLLLCENVRAGVLRAAGPPSLTAGSSTPMASP